MADRGRKPSTTRDELLQRVVDHLAQHGIAKATFRSLAASLNMSTYPLVHYFGSKEQLLDAVVAEVERRQQDLVEKYGEGDHLGAWQWCLDNRELLRLDLEILLEQGRESTNGPLADRVFREWHQLYIERYMAEGMPYEQAEVEATLHIAGIVGLQLDLITTGDADRTTRAFRMLDERRMSR